MNKDQQLMWDTLKGPSHPTIVQYYQKDPSKLKKYMKIQKALYYDNVAFTPVQAERKGPGGVHDDWKKGVEKIAEHLPQRRTVIPRAVAWIEDEMRKLGYKRIKWDKITWAFKPVYTRYGADIGLGCDVLIEGVAKGGLRVCYYYDNSSNAEGAHRYAILGKKKCGFARSELVETLAKVAG